MKTKSLLLAAAALITASLLHAEKTVAGPKGGRLLETEPLKSEFFVTPDHHVEINFLDAALQPVAPGTQIVSVIAEPTSGKTPLELEKTATGFVSKTTLPDGAPYRVVVQTRASADAKPKNFRIDLNLATCGECQKAEYACICDGH